MYISDELKFCFVHIPKTGGTSIKKALSPWANKDQLNFIGEKVIDCSGWHPHQAITFDQANKYEGYFKFTIVRNPWERHASLWKFLRGLQDQYIGLIDFSTYIYKVCCNQLIYSQNQHEYIQYDDQFLVDYIGRFENLQESYDYICDKIGLEYGELPHIKNQGDYDYRDMYDQGTRDAIQMHCKKDIQMFDYKF